VHAVLAALLLATTAAGAEPRVVVDRDGITVEEDGAEGRRLPILTGRTFIEAPPDRVVAWIEAAHTWVDWMHDCVEAREIRREGDLVVGYNRIDMPWPVADRDVVLHARVATRADGGYRAEFEHASDPDVPPRQGILRIPRLSGSYDLVPEADGTHIVYTVDTDPGGGLPAWLVRRVSREVPYRTLENLRDRAETGPPPPP
jgi:hypothetical protein